MNLCEDAGSDENGVLVNVNRRSAGRPEVLSAVPGLGISPCGRDDSRGAVEMTISTHPAQQQSTVNLQTAAHKNS